jgi:hypothetical protein
METEPELGGLMGSKRGDYSSVISKSDFSTHTEEKDKKYSYEW